MRTVATICLAILSVGACGGNVPPGSIGQPTPTTTTIGDIPIEEAPTPSPPSPLKRKMKIVAITEDARIVVLDAATGQEVRTLVDLSHEGGSEFPIESIDLSPDRRTVYFTQVSPRRHHSVRRVSVEGGDVERLVAGAAPSLSHDGHYLAFSYPVNGNPTTNHNAIGVLDLLTGETLRFELDEGEEDFFQVYGHIYSTSWSEDTERIAYFFEYEGSETRVINMSLNDSLSSAHQVPGDYSWAGWLPDQSLVVVDDCCFPEYQRRPGRVAIVDAVSGSVRKAFGTPAPVRSVHADARGRLLIVLRDGTLGRIDHETGFRPIAQGIMGASW